MLLLKGRARILWSPNNYTYRLVYMYRLIWKCARLPLLRKMSWFYSLWLSTFIVFSLQLWMQLCMWSTLLMSQPFKTPCKTFAGESPTGSLSWLEVVRFYSIHFFLILSNSFLTTWSCKQDSLRLLSVTNFHYRITWGGLLLEGQSHCMQFSFSANQILHGRFASTYSSIVI